MGMIVSDEHQFFYLHIPKCAGTTVSEPLAKTMPHDPRFAGKLNHTAEDRANKKKSHIDHPELGKLMGPHIPLAVLRDYYPDVFEKARTYSTYCVTRDPIGRFKSAVGQHTRTFSGHDINSLPIDRQARTIDDCIRKLEASPTTPGFEYMHLIRQADYIELDGETIADEIYPIEQVDQMMSDISARFGVTFPPARPRNLAAKSSPFAGRSPVLWKIGQAVRSILPQKLYLSLRKTIGRLLTTSHTDTKAPSAFDHPKVRAFIKDFYARDFELYAAAQDNMRGRAATST